jgi:hypothetical protein
LLSFKALVIPGVEGGAFARTPYCPDNKLRFSFSDADIIRIEAIGRKAEASSMLGAGIKGAAIVSIGKRVNPYFLTVGVEKLQSLNEMGLRETNEFIATYRIG